MPTTPVDFIDGLMIMIEKGVNRNCYHIGTMHEMTMRELTIEIGKALGRDVVTTSSPLPEGSTQRRCPDIGKLAALGYAPHRSFEAGVGDTARWYAANADHRPKK